MNTAIVKFDNGDTITTDINGDDAEIRWYYKVGRAFNLGDGENGLMANVVSVKTITTGDWFHYPHNGRWYRYIDTRVDGNLTTRVCEEDKTMEVNNEEPRPHYLVQPV